MFLSLSHQKLNIYQVTRKFVFECYKITKSFPPEERYSLTSQIRRAALSVHLNLAEGASRKSLVERRRFFEISRSSLIEIDAAFDIANDLNYLVKENCLNTGELMNQCFAMLSKMIQK